MKNDELKHNGSGYYDPTAYKAMKNYENGGANMVINKGEIWTVTYGYEEKMAVVIAVHGSYCSVLCLNDDFREKRNIALNARGMKYTESGMLSYKFNDAFVNYVRSTTEEEFEDILNKVADSLGLYTKCTPSNVTPIEIGYAQLKDELDDTKRKAQELKEENEALKAVRQPEPQDVIVLKTERDLYKKQYEMLLERLIGA